MILEECKKFIIDRVTRADELDIRFIRQLCVLIKKYEKEKRGH